MTFQGPKLFLDIETRSRCDLKAAGARRYAADPSTQTTTASWRWAGDPCSYDACNVPGLEHLGNATMGDFQGAIARAGHVVAHHINFDANVIFATLGPWGLTLDKLDCTMARAQRVSLPGGLDELCNALQVQGKSPDGYRLVMATCKPRKDGTFNEDPAIFRQLLAYNVQDVRCLESVDRMLPPLPPDELEIWRRTWRKNALGLPLDIELCQRIAAKRAEVELQLSKDLRSLTGGAVATVSQRQRIMTWLQSKKIQIPNLQKATLEVWLESEDLPFDAWQVLDHLFQSGGSAPTKAQALLDRHVRGRFQDGTRYFGARSGRGTSEGVNMFNIARPSGKYDTEEVIRRLKAEPDTVFSNTELSDVLRGAVVAPPGMKLLDVDLSNIELRLSLWYAGDREKLAQLANDEDLYANTAAVGMGIPGLTKKTHPKERQAYKKVCFGPDTLVLTRSGWRRIVDVKQEDMVWDGIEWVHQQGLLRQGVKDTMTLLGVAVTADHCLLSGARWATAKDLAVSAPALRRALATASANLPSRAIWLGMRAAACSVFLSAATVARQSTASVKKTLSAAGRQHADGAQWLSQGVRTVSDTGTQKLRKIMSWRAAFTRAWRRFMTVVGTLATGLSTTTADAGYAYGRAGLPSAPSATSGMQLTPASLLSCATFLRLRGIVTPIWSWIASTTMAAMSRVTFALYRAARTELTGAQSRSCSTSSMEVFDLLNCGPRHRFTILSSGGPLLAHNCLSGGYAIGVMRLFNAFKTDKDLPYDFRRDLTYAQVAAIHSGYRDANWRLQACWKELDTAARAALYARGTIVPACDSKLSFLWRRDVDILELQLPSRRTIPHYQPKIRDGELIFYRAKFGRMLESRAFGGSWLEIACQSAARDVLTGVERQVEAELPDVQLMLDIYDSIVALAPAAVAEQRMGQIIQIMRRVPAWAAGLPLNAEGMFGDRMSK